MGGEEAKLSTISHQEEECDAALELESDCNSAVACCFALISALLSVISAFKRFFIFVINDSIIVNWCGND
jgi:hypothetical protein